MSKIKSGIFIMPFHDPSKPLHVCHDEDLELLVEADRLGLDEFWVGEHQTLKWEPIVSPEMFIAAGFRQTDNIRIGPAPLLLNLHHPASVASRLSFLDHFSHGRLNLAFGYGGTPSDQELLGTKDLDSFELTKESAKIILKLWELDPPYKLENRFWDISLESKDDVIGYGEIQKPFQRPHPPISVPVTGRNSRSAKLAAQYGFSPFSHSITATSVLADNWATYSNELERSGNTPDRRDWKIARTIFLADSDEKAEKIARSNSIMTAYRYLASAIKKGPGLEIMKDDVGIEDSEIDDDYFINNLVIAGSVETVLQRILRLIDDVGTFGTLINMSFDWINDSDRRYWMDSMALFQTELMPRLNKAIEN
ncbi:uncharacterized protein METZ01_LOCUS153174 [marine metagenome]|uniref:Luciferase-like domain-containing protein n=1 Tax=marine metagenome TaxID=408172 RepID=A0A382AFH9_9ZZZZ